MNVMILSMTGEVLEPAPEVQPADDPERDAVIDMASGTLQLEPVLSDEASNANDRTRRGLLAMQCLATL